MKKLVCLTLIFCLLLSFSAFAEEPNLALNSKSYILIEANSAKVLYENNSKEHLAPASITKIMSLILVMEALNDGRLTKETVLVCSDTAAALGGSQIWLEPGEQMSVHDLLKATVIVSANDATVLLAEAVAGSEEAFVELMNAKAKELNMKDTNFCNATGLDAPDHYSCAFDISIMARELLKYKDITEYTTVWMDTLRGGESELVNTNRLVRYYKGCTGLKTGTTATAGYCLAASATRDNLSLIAVVMNADNSNNRFADAQKLLNYGFANYSYVTYTPTIEENTIVNVNGGVKKSVGVRADGEFSSLVKKSDENSITNKVNLLSNIDAPVTKNTVLGSVDYYLNDEKIGSVNITPTEECEKMSFYKAFEFIFKMLTSL